jgi:hypothetical protein
MTKDDVLQKVKSLNLQYGSYIVYGSAPFAILGIREVNDIDLLVSEELYSELQRKGWKRVYKGPKDEPLTFDIFDAHKSWSFSPYAPTLQQLLSRAFEIEGVPFATLEDVKKWKEASERPKDIEDLKLIKLFFENS